MQPSTPRRSFAAAIRATTDPQMKARAAALGERIRAEDGIGHAVEIIEAFVNNSKRGNGDSTEIR